MLAVGKDAMKRVLRLAWRGATFAGAIAMLCAANARALDNPAATAPIASTSAASTSATAAPATPAAAAAPAPAVAQAVPQLPVSSVLKPGQWVVLPPVQPAAATSPSVAATRGVAAIPMPMPAAALAPPVPAVAPPPAAVVAVPASAATIAASPAAPAPVSASGAALSAAAPVAPPPAAMQPPAAAAAAPAPRLAALTPPGGAAAVAPAGGPTPAAGATAKDQPTPGAIALRNTNDPSIVSNPYSWSVMVYKSQHRLVIYYRGHLYKEYHAVFGRNLDPGTKLWSGDRRTPEGAYTIIAKRLNSRWRYFLKLDYPNSADRTRYEQLVERGEVPRFRGRAISEGDGIGIHGTDEPILNTGNVNWTTGCISVDNGAIDEIEALLPVGTLVVIKP